MVRIWMLAFVLGLAQLTAVASAETFIEAITNCLKINSQERRYQCYDAAESERSMGNVEREVAKFNYEANSDPITGQTLHTLSIRSDRGLNSRGDPIILRMTCDSTRPGEYMLRLQWGDFLESSNPEITTRLGQENSVTGSWETDSRRETSILAGSEAGYTKTEFIDSLVEQVDSGNQSVVFRTSPYNADPITAVFDFTGFLDVLQPMRESCRF